MNPKDYFRKYQNNDANKHHKCMRKETFGMTFDIFASRILSLNNHEYLDKKSAQKMIIKQIANCARWNKNDICSKNYMARLSQKRFSFADDDLS